jgi:hypothetical protein
LEIYVETSSYSWVVSATNDDSIGLMLAPIIQTKKPNSSIGNPVADFQKKNDSNINKRFNY